MTAKTGAGWTCLIGYERRRKNQRFFQGYRWTDTLFAGKRLDTLDGTVAGPSTRFRPPPRRVAYVPQGREVFPMMTVDRKTLTNRASLCLPKKRPKSSPPRIYDLFSRSGRETKTVGGGDLSGGQSSRQLCHCARADHQPRCAGCWTKPTEGIQPNIHQADRPCDPQALRDEGEMRLSGRAVFSILPMNLADECVALKPWAVVSADPRPRWTAPRLLSRARSDRTQMRR